MMAIKNETHARFRECVDRFSDGVEKLDLQYSRVVATYFAAKEALEITDALETELIRLRGEILDLAQQLGEPEPKLRAVSNSHVKGMLDSLTKETVH
jgi:hypothetical protein